MVEGVFVRIMVERVLCQYCGRRSMVSVYVWPLSVIYKKPIKWGLRDMEGHSHTRDEKYSNMGLEMESENASSVFAPYRKKPELDNREQARKND